MKLRLLLVSLFTAFLAAGCGQKETASAPAAGGTAAAPAAGGAASAPAAAPAAKGPRVIEITANDAMKFSMATIDAKVGEELKIVLTNIGTAPKIAMGHNLVVLKAGTDANTFSMASMMAKDTDYIPAQLKDQVIAHTKVLGPRESDEITVKLTAAGEYAYICSFPAHYGAGMKGVINVK